MHRCTGAVQVLPVGFSPVAHLLQDRDQGHRIVKTGFLQTAVSNIFYGHNTFLQDSIYLLCALITCCEEDDMTVMDGVRIPIERTVALI